MTDFSYEVEKNQPKCAKCGSERIIPPVEIMDQGKDSSGRLRAHVGCSDPLALLFKGNVYAQFRATICGECGHTELTAENPAQLYEAYRASRLRP